MADLLVQGRAARESVAGQPVPLMLVDDHDIWRSGLRMMLDGSEFEVVAEARTVAEVLPAARAGSPRIVLQDIRLPDGDGFDALGALKSEFPDILVVMLTAYENPTFMARALAAGASGYLFKGVTREELLTALRIVVDGKRLQEPQELVRSLHTVSEQAARSGDLFVPLSRREEEVLRLVATGISNREIGKILFIAEGTVKSHIEHILNKLGVGDRVQLAVWAARNGLLPEKSGEAGGSDDR